MQSRPQMEAIAQYLTDFLASIPQSCRPIVEQHIQQCLLMVNEDFQNLECRIKGLEYLGKDNTACTSKKEGPY